MDYGGKKKGYVEKGKDAQFGMATVIGEKSVGWCSCGRIMGDRV